MMPVLYISHGAPTIPLEDGTPANTFLRGMLGGLTPRAIVMVSAHWEAAKPTVTGASRLETIHDFHGFPPELYALRYEPPGDPALARRVADLIPGAVVDDARGIDHGGWTPLILARPQADIPVVQLSLLRGLEPREHLALGRALAPLRAEGVLVVGSGGAVHNLRDLDWANPDAPPPGWAAEFQDWLDGTVALARPEREAALADWLRAPQARRAHPREEHLMPLHVAAGAAGVDHAKKLHQSWQFGSLSLAAWQFGDF